MSYFEDFNTLEKWLAREVFRVKEVPPEIVKHFEEWREAIEQDILRWMRSDDGDGNPLSWRGWGRGFASIPDKDDERFETLVMQLKLQLVKEVCVDKIDKEIGQTISSNEIRRLQEVEKQYRNYRDTIRGMLNSGELVYKDSSIKSIHGQFWCYNCGSTFSKRPTECAKGYTSCTNKLNNR